MPLFFTLLVFLSYVQYIHTFLHPWTFAEAPLHSLIADQLSGRHLPGVPSRDSNSGPPYSEPASYQLSHAAPSEPCRTLLIVGRPAAKILPVPLIPVILPFPICILIVVTAATNILPVPLIPVIIPFPRFILIVLTVAANILLLPLIPLIILFPRFILIVVTPAASILPLPLIPVIIPLYNRK